MNTMYKIEEVIEKIKKGESLLLAGNESALKELPRGNWIAGTIPYFMSEDGGKFSKEEIYVTEIPGYMENIEIKTYDESNISEVYTNIPENGLGLIIIPATSPTHLKFGTEALLFPAFATNPLLGWISGVDLAELGKVTAKVVDGTSSNPKFIENGAIVMQMKLPDNKYANMEYVTIFEMGEGDTLEFNETGFSAKQVIVNGKEENFVEYVKKNNLNTQLPLVTDFSGTKVNISFQEVKEDEVTFYAPIFRGIQYKHAAQITDYVSDFEKCAPQQDRDKILFACNCILNYLYGELEGKKTGGITGPITFGEVGYQLLNQTMAYVTILDK